VYDENGKGWMIEAGDYDVSLSADSRNVISHQVVHVAAARP
jgi:hypothetical protein